MAKRKAKTLTARVTHLEMTARPMRSIPLPSKPRTALLQTSNVPLHFYRYLYERIGREHHWYERRMMSDEDLGDILGSSDTIIDVLYADGCPAGFFELTKSAQNNDMELTYFGIMSDYQGLGLGRWFLNSAIQRAWDEDPDKLTVHTNTLDHPSALGLYQKMGFSPVAVSEEVVTVWE